VSRYVHTDINHLPTAENPSKNFFHKGLPVENPWTMDGESDFLFHNRATVRLKKFRRRRASTTPARDLDWVPFGAITTIRAGRRCSWQMIQAEFSLHNKRDGT